MGLAVDAVFGNFRYTHSPPVVNPDRRVQGLYIQFLNEVPAPVPAFQDPPALGFAAMVMLSALPSAPQESSHAQGRSSGLAQAERCRTRNYGYIGRQGKA